MLKSNITINEAENGFSISIVRKFIDKEEKENSYEETSHFVANTPHEVNSIIISNWELPVDN